MSTRWSCLCHAMDPAAETGSALCEGLFAWPPPANELSSVDAERRTMDPAPNVGPAPNCPAGSSLSNAAAAGTDDRRQSPSLPHSHAHRRRAQLQAAAGSDYHRRAAAVAARPRHHARHIISTGITRDTALTTQLNTSTSTTVTTSNCRSAAATDCKQTNVRQEQ